MSVMSDILEPTPHHWDAVLLGMGHKTQLLPPSVKAMVLGASMDIFFWNSSKCAACWWWYRTCVVFLFIIAWTPLVGPHMDVAFTHPDYSTSSISPYIAVPCSTCILIAKKKEAQDIHCDHLDVMSIRWYSTYVEMLVFCPASRPHDHWGTGSMVGYSIIFL